ncbi:MAG: hypothetical protein K5768_01260 [Firmicutes bacterium]|nr:hypothetical protein [Bacillota bacterium]
MKKTVLNVLMVIITVFMIFFPEKSILYSKQALSMCYEIIIPSLFPFFVCSGILVYSGFAQTLSALFRPVMKPLFNVNENGAAAFVLGIISGYPLGAVTTCQLYENAYLSKSEAERLLAFCNNSGPLFILGAVGTAMFKNPKIGIILYISHIVSAVLVGILARFYQKDKFCAPKSRLTNVYESPSEIFSKVLANSINSILTVCGAIIFFFTVSGIVMGFMPFSPPLNAFFSALLEFTGGIKRISLISVPLSLRIIVSSFCVGFAGLCVHIQVMAVTARYGLSLKPYIFGKFLHGIFSAALTYLLLKLFPQTVSVFKMSGAAFSGGFYFGSMYVIFSAFTILFMSIITLILLHNKRDA